MPPANQSSSNNANNPPEEIPQEEISPNPPATTERTPQNERPQPAIINSSARSQLWPHTESQSRNSRPRTARRHRNTANATSRNETRPLTAYERAILYGMMEEDLESQGVIEPRNHNPGRTREDRHRRSQQALQEVMMDRGIRQTMQMQRAQEEQEARQARICTTDAQRVRVEEVLEDMEELVGPWPESETFEEGLIEYEQRNVWV